jgi:transcriptional regulator with XRE-family HTH domain
MKSLSPESFGQMVANKRGSMGIREAAAEIGISPATLSRIERGHLPDSRRLGKICAYLGIDPARLIGGVGTKKSDPMPAVQIGFKKGGTFNPQTAKSLANLIIAAHKAFIEKISSEG